MTVTVTDSATFRYNPPRAAHAARRVIIKPNLGYPVGPPVTVSLPVLREVIAGVRRVAPDAEIIVLEGVCTKTTFAAVMDKLGVTTMLADLADPKVILLDADREDAKTFPNTSREVQRFTEMDAPELLDEVDCRISVGCLKRTALKGRPLISSSIKNLYGLFPRERYRGRSPHARGQLHVPDVQRVIADVYFTLGVKFDGAVVDADQKFISRDWQPDLGHAEPVGKVIFGDDLVATDRRACEIADEPISDYLALIERLRG
jgi:hypothetical protein